MVLSGLASRSQILYSSRHQKLSLLGVRLQGETRQLSVELVRSNGGWQLAAGSFTAALLLKQLEKIPKLSSRRLTVLAGNADVRLTASARQGHWKVTTAVELTRVRLRGEPFYTMPMGLLQLTPENVWPMAEDSPGLLAFSFETRAAQGQLIKEFTVRPAARAHRQDQGKSEKKGACTAFLGAARQVAAKLAICESRKVASCENLRYLPRSPFSDLRLKKGLSVAPD
jgi:hypothetical protein